MSSTSSGAGSPAFSLSPSVTAQSRHEKHDAGRPAVDRVDPQARPRRLRQTARSSPSVRAETAARRSPRSAPTRPGWRTACARSASRATRGSAPSCGTTRSTWRPTSPSRRWARCCTRSTSGCSRSRSSYIADARRGPGRHRGRVGAAAARALHRRHADRAHRRRHRRRRHVSDRGAPASRSCRYADLLGRRRDVLRLARRGRARRRRDVLHERHDRQPEGCRLLASLDVAALARGVHQQQPRAVRAGHRAGDRAAVPRERVGHSRTPPSWPAPIWSCRTVSCRPSRWCARSRPRSRRCPARCRRSGTTSSTTCGPTPATTSPRSSASSAAARRCRVR